MPLNVSGVHACGERPDEFRPCSALSSGLHISANKSLPRPLLQGSTTVSAAAVAMMASIALPPARIIESPACEANGCVVETTLRVISGERPP